MTVKFDIPARIEAVLKASGRDASSAAKEAALVELYRQDRISHVELAEALNLSRYETDGVLKRHGVVEDLPTPEDLGDPPSSPDAPPRR